MNHKELIAAYIDTDYFVDGINQPIRIGEKNNEIIDLLIDKKSNSYAFITAFNPMSEQYTDEQNKALNQLLEEEIVNYYYRKGIGKSRSGAWLGEDSFFIVGITRLQAQRLMSKYRQRAIVLGNIEGVAELVVNESEK